MPLAHSPKEPPKTKNCQSCTADDDVEPMVQCDQCDLWQHYTCAGVTAEVEDPNVSYVCSTCLVSPFCCTCRTRGTDADTVCCCKCTKVIHVTCAAPKPSTEKNFTCKYCAYRTPKDKGLDLQDEIIKELQEEERERAKIAAKEAGERRVAALTAGYEARLKELNDIINQLKAKPPIVPNPSTPVSSKVLSPATIISNSFANLSLQEAPKVPPATSNNGIPAWNQTLLSTPITSTHSLPPNYRPINVPHAADSAANSTASASIYPPTITIAGVTYTPTSCSLQAATTSTNSSHVNIAGSAANLQPPISTAHLDSGADTNAIAQPSLTPQQIATRRTITSLPYFDGDVEKFPVFLSYFEETTKSCGFTNQENLLRLIPALGGRAAAHVSGLLTVAENVPYLIERLKAIYGRPEQVIESLLCKVRRLPAPSLENMNQLIDYGIAVHNVVTTMKSTKMEAYLSDPIAIKSRLGWSIYGKLDKTESGIGSLNLHTCLCEKTNQLIESSLTLDSIGITKSPELLLSSDDKRAIETLTSATKRIDERFETALLWRYDDIELPDNYSMALRRTKCLVKRMKDDPQLAANLHKQIQDMKTANYIRELSPDEVKQKSRRTWYLPIFPVLNPNKPGKVRLVWDAAAKFKGFSLNDVLLKGPDAVPLLTTPLMRLRERKIAITGDIQAMFHQVAIRTEDQDSQRFLWPKDDDGNMSVFVMQRMTFGSTCSPSAAQLVKNLNAEEFKEKYPRAVQAIQENHYVDDWLDSTDTVEEAIELAKQVREIHKNAGFHIHQWKSNSRDVKNALSSADPSHGEQISLDLQPTHEKLLGMWWSPDDDNFTYLVKFHRVDPAILTGEKIPTKRQVLSLLMSIFDPNGFLNHFVIHLRILLQDIWRSGKNWDEEISPEHMVDWLDWLSHLKNVNQVKIRRCFLNNLTRYDDTDVQLHTFVDAGKEAYAIVAYLRISNKDEVDVAIVGSKSRVARLNSNSTPQLELQSALVGARYAKYVKETLTIKINSFHYWCDSATVLTWLFLNKRDKPFIGFRVAEIQELTSPEEWHWISSEMNVADLATKSTKKINLSPTSEWLIGPQFLYKNKDEWPIAGIPKIEADSAKL